MKRMKSLLLSLLVVLGAEAFADNGLQLSLWVPDHQRVPEDEPINGFSLGIWSRNSDLTGVALAGATQFTGEMTGWQCGLVLSQAESVCGIQEALINEATTVNGAQFGIFNYCTELHGVQFGLINCATTGRGLQIGLINVFTESSFFPIFPIVNFRF